MFYKKFLNVSIVVAGMLAISNPIFAQPCPSPTGVSVSTTSICVNTPITLNANLPAGVNTINWYTAATGGTPIATTNTTSTTFTPTNPGTYTFYAEGVGAGGGSVTHTFNYTGAVQQVTLQPGTYQIESWGADGYTQTAGYCGRGGYAAGSITITTTQTFYIYVGGVGTYSTVSPVPSNTWTFNGGGWSYPANNASYGHGGGATDMRTIGGNWDDVNSLDSRIIVAGGGGAGRNSSYIGGHGGGLTGGTGTYFSPDQTGGPTGGTQTAGGTNTPWTGFTMATKGKAMTYNGGTLSASFFAGGGGGYYGGASGRVAGGGGSSYIGGVTGGTTVMYGQSGFVANPVTNGNGFLRITGQSACSPGPRVATATVTVHNTPVVDLGNDTAVCKNEMNSKVLNAGNAGSSYVWNNNTTNQTLTVAHTGTFWVRVTNSNGCSASDTINVTFNQNPEINLGNDTTICPEAILNLSVFSPGDTYLWDDNSMNANRTIVSGGTYFVTVTNNKNCKASDTIIVSNFSSPVTALRSDTAICLNTSITLDPGSFNSYMWDNYSVVRTRTVSGAGTYKITVTDNNGCKGTDSIVVSIIPKAQTNGFSFVPYFYGSLGKVLFEPLNPRNVAQYFWDFGDGNTSNIDRPIHTYQHAGKYQVKLIVSEIACGSETYEQEISIELGSMGVVDNNSQLKATIFPNPTNNELNITFDKKHITFESINVTDLLGRHMPVSFEGQDELKINTSKLASGLYNIIIVTNEGVFNAKFEVIK
jgi:hypothetical protein